jgi:protein SCO1/2
VLSLTAHRLHSAALRLAPLLPLLALLSGALLNAAGAAEGAGPYALPLQWQDDQGSLVRLEQFRGQPVLLTMAYATCRETCSYALHRLDQLQREAAQAGQPLQIVVVSYDPANDGPRSWTSYRQHHSYVHPNWHFLTGTDAATRQLAGALDFKYWDYDEHVVHDFKILLLDADGMVKRELTWPNRDESLFVTPRP